MNTARRAARRFSSLLVGTIAVTMCIPALSNVVRADAVQSLPETTCKEVLANWEVITIGDGGVISGNVNLGTTYLVSTINQLFCIGAGSFEVDTSNNSISNVGVDCRDTSAKGALVKLMHARYMQINDLDFNDLTVSEATVGGALRWRPIGNNGCQFMGEYDGNLKKISNLYYNEPSLTSENRPFEGVALFGSTGDNNLKPSGTSRTAAVIKNVILDNATFIGNEAVGGIVGIADDNTQLNNVSVSGVIGIRREDGWAAGGLIGWANGGTNNVTANPVVISDSDTQVKIIVHDNGTGGATGAGGLVGHASNTNISGSSAHVEIQAKNTDYVGGLAGEFYVGVVDTSFSTGSISIDKSGAGGLIGDANFVDISDSFSTATVSGNSEVGGIAGWGQDITIDTSYAAGGLKVTSSNIGGLIGARYQIDNVITDSYWDKEINSVDKSVGDNAPEVVDSVHPKTTYEMTSLSTYSPSWSISSSQDASKTWRIDPNRNGGYPFLQSNEQPATCINVLKDWGMITFNASSNPSMIIDIDLDQTYEVSSIDQLYCIGEGAFDRSGFGFSDADGRTCNDNSAVFSKLMYASYLQTANLNFNDLTVSNFGQWRPIGNQGCQFRGTYDGDGFEIRNMYHNQPNVDFANTPHEGIGIWGSTGKNDRVLDGFSERIALIENINLVDVYFAGWQDVGGIVGIADEFTEINNVSVSGIIGVSNQGWGDFGGIIGWVNGSTVALDNQEVPTVQVTQANVNVQFEGIDSRGDAEAEACIGGIVGYADNVAISTSTSDVQGNSQLLSSIGGIGGCFQGSTIEDSHATANLSAQNSIGGLVGWASSTSYNRSAIAPTVIKRSSSEATLNGSGDKVGGLVGGYESLVVEDSYATGSVHGASSVGGLFGGFQNWNDQNKVQDGLRVARSYASVTVTGTDPSRVGGIVGHLGEDEELIAVIDNVRTVIEIFDPIREIADSFWDTEISGLNTNAGDLGTGETTSRLKTLSTFTNAEWDIVEGVSGAHTWGITAGTNSGYPFLQVRTTNTPDNGGGNSGGTPSNSGSTPATNSAPKETLQEQIRNRKWMESRTKEQFKQFTPAQLAAMPLSSIRGITTTHASVMTRAQLLALTPMQIRVLRPSTLAKLPSDWLSDLSTSQIKEMLPRQIRALSVRQIQSFTSKQKSLIASVMSKAVKLSR